MIDSGRHFSGSQDLAILSVGKTLVSRHESIILEHYLQCKYVLISYFFLFWIFCIYEFVLNMRRQSLEWFEFLTT